MICIQLEGTSRASMPMSMDLVGLRSLEVDFSKKLSRQNSSFFDMFFEAILRQHSGTETCRNKHAEKSRQCYMCATIQFMRAPCLSLKESSHFSGQPRNVAVYNDNK